MEILFVLDCSFKARSKTRTLAYSFDARKVNLWWDSELEGGMWDLIVFILYHCLSRQTKAELRARAGRPQTS